jgi:hypothetical protein
LHRSSSVPFEPMSALKAAVSTLVTLAREIAE